MFFCTEKRYPTITLDALSDFTEDKRAAERFARRFWPLSFSCVAALLCFGAFIFIPIFRGQSDSVPQIYVVLGVLSFAVAIVLFVFTWRRMVACVPVGQHSSKPMEVFQLQDTIKEGRYELVYLCRQSRTFFRVVYKAAGD
jgi:protein-S-isoprenylcysteine O-methyltransferase Ste14